MPTYKVTTLRHYHGVYIVDAATPEEAEKLVFDGQVDRTDDEFVCEDSVIETVPVSADNDPFNAELVERVVEFAKSEITKDIANGEIPSDISLFETLHEHVDANEYLLAEGVQVPKHTPELNAALEQIDDWLEAGRPV